MKICVFSKHFQDLDADALGKTLAELGVPGVDLTVRGEGHVEPARVAEDLPRFRDALARHGIAITMLTTNITDINEPTSKPVIETAAKLGVKFIKLGYWPYKGWEQYRKQEKAVRQALQEMEPVLLKNGVTAGFHVHSGEYIGLNANYIMRLIEDRDPKALGVYYDIGHSALEGGVGGWKLDLDLAKERLVMVALKNMIFYKKEGVKEGRHPWSWKVVPLSEGLADVPAFIGLLKDLRFSGPVSFHSEYQGEWSWRDLKGRELVDQTRLDLNFARPLIQAA